MSAFFMAGDFLFFSWDPHFLSCRLSNACRNNSFLTFSICSCKKLTWKTRYRRNIRLLLVVTANYCASQLFKACWTVCLLLAKKKKNKKNHSEFGILYLIFKPKDILTWYSVLVIQIYKSNSRCTLISVTTVLEFTLDRDGNLPLSPISKSFCGCKGHYKICKSQAKGQRQEPFAGRRWQQPPTGPMRNKSGLAVRDCQRCNNKICLSSHFLS